MEWLTDKQIEEFLDKKNYDIRISNNARWIDQKCTPDVLTIIADCILEYVNNNSDDFFGSIDIWHNKYTEDNVEAIFKKPNTENINSRNEYDKFFQQPIEMFANAGILSKKKDGNKNLYKVSHKPLLEFISISEMNALKFINLYCKKVLKDSNIYSWFEEFFKKQDAESYDLLKTKYAEFIINNTPINQSVECNRIFSKILNPIAFMIGAKGTKGGKISQDKITKDLLMYNRNNFRDLYKDKPKDMTRKEFEISEELKPNADLIKYQSAKAKKLLRSFNEKFRDGLSEVNDEFSTGKATQIHHIFPEKDYSSISGYVENLIALTPNQHFLKAHPNNKTSIINKYYQHICLLAKSDRIEDNILNGENKGEDVIYSFDNFKYVLSTGLESEDFDNVRDLDFLEMKRLINALHIYSDSEKLN